MNEQIRNKVHELLQRYFELGVAEGIEGRDYDTAAGDAQNTLSEIMGLIEAASARYAGSESEAASDVDAMLADAQQAIKDGDKQKADMYLQAVRIHLSRPAPAVPEGIYSIDADPHGIRQLVSDAITGALMLGAQGNNRPPEGHWLTPFWEMAAAQPAPPERKCSECGDGREGLSLYCVACLNHDGWSLSSQTVVEVPEGYMTVPIKTIREVMSCVYPFSSKLYDELQAMLSAQENTSPAPAVPECCESDRCSMLEIHTLNAIKAFEYLHAEDGIFRIKDGVLYRGTKSLFNIREAQRAVRLTQAKGE